MKKFLPLLVAAFMALSVPALAQQGLGKGGGGNGGGNSGGNGGGSGGGSAPPPPTRGSGGSSGGNSAPPVRGGGNNSGNNSGGNSGSDRNGGGRTTGGNSNGGQTAPPDRGTRQGPPPPVGNGDQRQSAPPTGRNQNESSRSGRVEYGGTNNQAGRSAPNYSPPPMVGQNRASREADQENRVGYAYGNYRNGYYQYSNQWCDNNFWYPHYQFNYSNNCVPSPWYGYTNMPGYIAQVRVTFGNFSFSWRSGDVYRWRYEEYDDSFGYWNNSRYERSQVDRAVDDIYDSFRRGRARYMDALIPTRGSVWVELDRYSCYSISGNDFYDLMEDLIDGTRTYDYRIREVRRYGNQATVIADHVFLDSWGRQQIARHYYGLQMGRRGYEIVAFRVEN